jgi:hypothetical protein
MGRSVLRLYNGKKSGFAGGEDARDSFEHAFESGNFAHEMPGAGRSEFVGAHTAVCGRNAPLGFYEFRFQEALQGGVEGAFFDLEQIVGGALDVLRESIAVKRLNFQSAQNHHLESAGEKIAWFVGFHRCQGSESGWFSQGLDQNSLRDV